MLKDSRLPKTSERLTSEDLATKFESVVGDVISRKISKYDVLAITRDEFGIFHVFSDLAPVGSCSQAELDTSFGTFIENLTGENQRGILEMALREPDHKKQEHYYDELQSYFATLRGDLQLSIKILVDDRGIISAIWSLQNPGKKKTETSLSNIFQKFGTIFSLH